jgi:hypothetical protein
MRPVCRACGDDDPRPSTLTAAIRLAVGVPVGIALVRTALLAAAVLLKDVMFPALAFIVRIYHAALALHRA